MNPVWLVRGRQLANRMRFWTAIVGYDPRDRSLSHRLYLIYLLIFFSLWGFSVLALLADYGAIVLSIFTGFTPSAAAILIILILLLVDFLLRSYRSTIRSPYHFSEEDAALICQTPVDRRQVSIAWMLGDWFPTLLPYLAVGVVLCFANIQLIEQENIQWSRLPYYILQGFRAASIIIPLHLTLMTINYSVGTLRLRDDKDIPAMRIFPIGLAAILVGLPFFNSEGWQRMLWPLTFPLKSGFGESSWLAGFTFAILLAGVCLVGLYLVSARLNLSRAAQESRFLPGLQQLSWLGASPLDRRMKTRERLGTGHAASLIPGKAGVWSLVWKGWITSLRTMNIARVLPWLSIIVVCGVMISAPSLSVQILAFIFWAVLVSQRCIESIQSDLERWVIFRQLPFKAERMILAEAALPVLCALCLSWLAYFSSIWLGLIPDRAFLWLIPVSIINIAMTASVDILRQSRCSDLLEGYVAGIGAGGVIVILLLAGLPIVFVRLLSTSFLSHELLWLAILLGFSLSCGIALMMWKLAASYFRKIK